MKDDTKRHASLTLGRAQARIGDVPYAVTMRIDGHAIVADEPEALDGQNAGPRPFGLLLAALGACTLMTLLSAASFMTRTALTHERSLANA